MNVGSFFRSVLTVANPRIVQKMSANGPAVVLVNVAERTEAVGRIYRIDFQVL
jgi:hypothetical protein